MRCEPALTARPKVPSDVDELAPLLVGDELAALVVRALGTACEWDEYALVQSQVADEPEVLAEHVREQADALDVCEKDQWQVADEPEESVEHVRG